jgi:hypothetical protein
MRRSKAWPTMAQPLSRSACSGHAAFGGQARYSFSPGKKVRPFIGLSAGYQRLLLFGVEEDSTSSLGGTYLSAAVGLRISCSP